MKENTNLIMTIGFLIILTFGKMYLSQLKEIRYLEIGSFEGRSAVFIGENK